MASYNYNELWKKHNKLRYYRLENNYTQQYVADFLKITQQNYQKYESGSLRPSVFLIIKLTELYKTPIEELTGYNELKKS